MGEALLLREGAESQLAATSKLTTKARIKLHES